MEDTVHTWKTSFDDYVIEMTAKLPFDVIGRRPISDINGISIVIMYSAAVVVVNLLPIGHFGLHAL